MLMYCTVLYCIGRDVHQRVRLLELGGHGGQAPGAGLLQQGQAGRLPLTLVPVTSWSKYVLKIIKSRSYLRLAIIVSYSFLILIKMIGSRYHLIYSYPRYLLSPSS